MAHAKLNLRADHLIVSPPNKHQAATHYSQREKISLPSKYWILCLLSLCFAGVLLKVELPMLMGFNPEWEHRVKSYISLLHIHAFFGSVALVIGGLQFLSLSKQWHRRLGRGQP